ncbi:hypothetical protein DXB87_13840 [Phocaeicola plebeius]|uniref:Uncharacterized protein n=1 Tax=Phocaeicola plebeius TaxID=310297 RepID=A0A3E4Z5F0_9BACT|nr:hypothetical protein DXB87_13840 [Phocaeicola plebeius]
MSLQIPRKDKDFQLLFPVFICTRNVKTYMKTKRHKKRLPQYLPATAFRLHYFNKKRIILIHSK